MVNGKPYMAYMDPMGMYVITNYFSYLDYLGVIPKHSWQLPPKIVGGFLQPTQT